MELTPPITRTRSSVSVAIIVYARGRRRAIGASLVFSAEYDHVAASRCGDGRPSAWIPVNI